MESQANSKNLYNICVLLTNCCLLRMRAVGRPECVCVRACVATETAIVLRLSRKRCGLLDVGDTETNVLLA